MEFVGKRQPLTSSGLGNALEQIGLQPAEAAVIWAVVDVETSGVTQGCGFRLDGRPQILFERHVFRRETQGRFNAQAPHLSGPAGGYGGLGTQYAKLEEALALCLAHGLGPEPALRSASWGLGQIMGFNARLAGHESAEAMVRAMTEGEDEQILAMARFLNARNLHKALQRRDWAAFARGYNGAGYAQNQYDIKLEQAYARLASGSLPNLQLRAAQIALLYLGFSPGKVDGVIGQRTRNALNSFRLQAGLPPGGDLDGPCYVALCQKAGLRP
ncbi:N-acetylmuramidase domain-containing protein [Propionivibrio sp.]|uniref:N-acetylmuramidase domain-containing protein n=1 Tax=Propionivibrio sp. TaxID=2212460 RepID=UPI00272E8A5C|nr:N-acetylmuramidase domain-containing protein [Propionivibrio sp.]